MGPGAPEGAGRQEEERPPKGSGIREGGRLIQRASFFFSVVPRGMWDLSSPTRDRTHTPCVGSAES